jgi:hypothetical protein
MHLLLGILLLRSSQLKDVNILVPFIEVLFRSLTKYYILISDILLLTIYEPQAIMLTVHLMTITRFKARGATIMY